VKFDRREISEIVRYLHDKKKISPASQTVATMRIAPKICQIQPHRVLQILSKSVNCRRSYSRTREHRQMAT